MKGIDTQDAGYRGCKDGGKFKQTTRMEAKQYNRYSSSI